MANNAKEKSVDSEDSKLNDDTSLSNPKESEVIQDNAAALVSFLFNFINLFRNNVFFKIVSSSDFKFHSGTYGYRFINIVQKATPVAFSYYSSDIHAQKLYLRNSLSSVGDFHYFHEFLSKISSLLIEVLDEAFRFQETPNKIQFGETTTISLENVGLPISQIVDFVDLDYNIVNNLSELTNPRRIPHTQFYYVREALPRYLSQLRQEIFSKIQDRDNNLYRWLNDYVNRINDYLTTDLIKLREMERDAIFPYISDPRDLYLYLNQIPYFYELCINFCTSFLMPSFETNYQDVSGLMAFSNINTNRLTPILNYFNSLSYTDAVKQDVSMIMLSLMMPGYFRIEIDFHDNKNVSQRLNNIMAALFSKILFLHSEVFPISTIYSQSLQAVDRIIAYAWCTAANVSVGADGFLFQNIPMNNDTRMILSNRLGQGWLNDGKDVRLDSDSNVPYSSEFRPVYAHAPDRYLDIEQQNISRSPLWRIGVAVAQVFNTITRTSIGATVIDQFYPFYIALNDFMRCNYYTLFRLTKEQLVQHNNDIDNVPIFKINSDSIVWFIRNAPTCKFTRSVEIINQIKAEIAFARSAHLYLSQMRLLQGFVFHFNMDKMYNFKTLSRYVVIDSDHNSFKVWIETLLQRYSLKNRIFEFIFSHMRFKSIENLAVDFILEDISYFLNFHGIAESFSYHLFNYQIPIDFVNQETAGDLFVTNIVEPPLPIYFLHPKFLHKMIQRSSIMQLLSNSVRKGFTHEGVKKAIQIRFPYQFDYKEREDANISSHPFEFHYNDDDIRSAISSKKVSIYSIFIDNQMGLFPDKFITSVIGNIFTGYISIRPEFQFKISREYFNDLPSQLNLNIRINKNINFIYVDPFLDSKKENFKPGD